MKKDKETEQADFSSNENPVSKKISRRGFLKGAGLTTAGTVVAGTGAFAYSSDDSSKESKTLGPGSTHINIKVNGHRYEAIIEPRVTLAELLRDHLQLTGTKIVCDRGSCSACTVYVNGKPVNSCITLAMDVHSEEITTIEGLARGEELHPVQEAFINQDASQCGFCTPGMVMSAVHLLEQNPKPSMEEVKKAVSGNLCRCGTHPHVFKAVMEASQQA